MSYYVEIPAECIPRLRFPEFCPFTLNSPADREWILKGTTKTDGFKIPGVPFFIVSGRDIELPIPVSLEFAQFQRKLALGAAWLSIPCFLLIAINAVVRKFDPLAEILMLGPFLAAIVYGWKRFLQRRVWIDYVGTNSVEIVFKRGDYADQFCDLNGLEYQRKFFNFRRSNS